MRLIDAEALERAVQASIAEYADVYTGEMIFGMRSVVFYATNGAPTVDAVPVIRCRDCARNPKYTARTHCPCPMDRYMGDDGWCAMARRKENA